LRYFLILLLFFSFPLSAAPEGGIALPPGWSATFVQKVTSPGKKVIEYSGDLLMDSRGRFKWSYRKPTRKEVCSDGKRIRVVDHDLEQVSDYRLEKGFDLGAILKQARHYRKNLYTAEYQGRTYTLAVDAEGRVEQIAYRDEMDNTVHIRFEKIRVLPKAPDVSRMHCPYPRDYDLIGG